MSHSDRRVNGYLAGTGFLGGLSGLEVETSRNLGAAEICAGLKAGAYYCRRDGGFSFNETRKSSFVGR